LHVPQCCGGRAAGALTALERVLTAVVADMRRMVLTSMTAVVVVMVGVCVLNGV
jgi:hypothetical protein